jgi:pimeloyl-ACP methyl ester carboxylesterase
MSPRIADWDVAYSNRLAVADSAEWLAESAREAARFQADYRGRTEIDLVYGTGVRQTFDVFHPLEEPRGTLIFIHGGYWRASSKEEHWHFAAGALAAGWRVVLPEYPLCPTVRVSEISVGIAQALDVILERLPEGPVVLSGHSAGGQLASYAASGASGLSERVRSRIGRVVSISGIHDLRPLLATVDLNGSLRLDRDEAIQFSPALGEPGHDFELFCVCGGAELAEFRRQNELLANIWTGLGLTTFATEYPGLNHFSILDLLQDPDSGFTRLLTLR